MKLFIQLIQGMARLSLESGQEPAHGVYVPPSPGAHDRALIGVTGESMQPDRLGDVAWRLVRTAQAIEFVVLFCGRDPFTKKDDAVYLLHHHMNGPLQAYRLRYDLIDGRPINIGKWERHPPMTDFMLGNPWLDLCRDTSILKDPASSFDLPEPFGMVVQHLTQTTDPNGIPIVPLLLRRHGDQVTSGFLSRISRGRWKRYLPDGDCVILTNVDARVDTDGSFTYEFVDARPTVDCILHLRDRRIQTAYARLCTPSTERPGFVEAFGDWHEAGDEVMAYWTEVLHLTD